MKKIQPCERKTNAEVILQISLIESDWKGKSYFVITINDYAVNMLFTI